MASKDDEDEREDEEEEEEEEEEEAPGEGGENEEEEDAGDEDDAGDDDDDDDDEDDDDEDGEDGDEAANTDEGVVLKGALRVEDGRLWWQGLWASSESAYADGSTSKFKYGGPQADGDAALNTPPGGAWNGYFMNPDASGGDPHKVREKGVSLSFEPTDDARTFVVAGDGTNEFGDFRLTGTYDTATRQLECAKAYAASPPDGDDDDDELDEDALDDDYEDELAGLKEEQDMPIDELARRYGADPPPTKRAKT